MTGALQWVLQKLTQLLLTMTLGRSTIVMSIFQRKRMKHREYKNFHKVTQVWGGSIWLQSSWSQPLHCTASLKLSKMLHLPPDEGHSSTHSLPFWKFFCVTSPLRGRSAFGPSPHFLRFCVSGYLTYVLTYLHYLPTHTLTPTSPSSLQCTSVLGN